MKRILLASAFLLALAPSAFAGSTTMGVKDASGTSHNFDMGTLILVLLFGYGRL